MRDSKSNEFKQKKKKSQSYKISLGIGKKKKKKKREIASKRIIRFGNLRKKWWIPYRERERLIEALIGTFKWLYAESTSLEVQKKKR